MLMPQFIADFHDTYIELFIDKGSLKSIAANAVIIFGKDKEGFLVPL